MEQRISYLCNSIPAVVFSFFALPPLIRVEVSIRKAPSLPPLPVSYGDICKRWQVNKLWGWYSASLCKLRMVSPIHALHPERRQAPVKADNLLIPQLHDFLGGQK